jgi:predicted  nucleic acid-binding Zn-ribbon protein
MLSRTTQLAWLTCFCAAFAFGCSKTTDAAPSGDESRVRETFTALQAAMKARDADKLWKLLDSESQADAERAAKAVQAAYAKADAKEKSEQDEALGLPGDQLAGLTAVGFLKTKRFHGKYDELSDSKIDKVTVQGDKAAVAYTELDGDKEKVSLVRQDGQWRVSLPMPKATQP